MKKILNILMAALVLTGISCSEDLEYKPGGVTPVQTLLLPANMLREGEDVFLDGMTLSELERALHVRALPVGTGEELVETLYACAQDSLQR